MSRLHVAPSAPAEDEEISLLDMLLVVARNRRLIVGTVAAFALIGLLIAVTSPDEYTSSAKVIREAPSGTGGMSGGLAALRGLGINLGGATAGLTPEAYPDIVNSREVRLAVVRDTFFFGDLERSMTFVEYTDRSGGLLATVKQYTIGLPGLLMSALRETPGGSAPVEEAHLKALTIEEESAIEALDNVISTNVSMETGLMSINATLADPYASAELVEAVLAQVTQRVRAIRTEKARMNLGFMQERFQDAARDLEAAEEKLATFHDRNFNPQTAQLRTELERLQRTVSFKSQLYSELQTQVTQAEIELQRSEPVVTVLEEPVIPVRPSGPHRKLIVILSLMLGLFAGVGAAFVRNAFATQTEDADEQEKLEEVRTAIVPQRVQEWWSTLRS